MAIPVRHNHFGVVFSLITLVWFGIVLGGFYLLLRYESEPAKAVQTSASWPRETELKRSVDLPTGVMFIHPHCPCTMSSLSELKRVIGICHDKAEFKIVCYDKMEENESWRRSFLVTSIRKTPGVEIFWDKSGQEMKLFNIQTSGHLLLYDVDGNLVYSGGITASRGHEGENAGTTFVKNWLRSDSLIQSDLAATPFTTPVFGCSLVSDSENDSDD